MFTVNEAEAATIRAAFDQDGELSAAIVLRRLFPGVRDSVQAQYWGAHHRRMQAAA